MLTWIIIKCHDGDIAVSRIVRVIRQPRGNMLLIGIGGSGRQSLTRLASFICDYDTFQIEVSKQYRRLEFREGKWIVAWYQCLGLEQAFLIIADNTNNWRCKVLVIVNEYVELAVVYD